MSSLANNALIDFNGFNEIAGIDQGNPNLKEERMHHFINSASRFIQDYCNRLFITPGTQITEYFTGDGTDSYYVKNGRIADAAATDLELAYRTSQSNFTVVAQSSYPVEIDADTGLIFLTSLTFHKGGLRNWYVKYKYGWTLANIPADLKTACAELVQRGVKLADGKEGLASEAFGDSSTTYNFASLPDNIKMVLNKYRMLHVG